MIYYIKFCRLTGSTATGCTDRNEISFCKASRPNFFRKPEMSKSTRMAVGRKGLAWAGSRDVPPSGSQSLPAAMTGDSAGFFLLWPSAALLIFSFLHWWVLSL